MAEAAKVICQKWMNTWLCCLRHIHFAQKKRLIIENLENEPFMLSEHGGKNEVTELLEKSGVHPQK